MAQGFVTTYNNSYRWPEIERRPLMRPDEQFAQELLTGDIWIVPKKIGEDDEESGIGLESAEASVKKMYRSRLWSIYQLDYCKGIIEEEATTEKASSFDDAILIYCKALYGPKTKKLPEPVPSAMRIHGYMRPERMYKPLTTYQRLHGKVGYDILNRFKHNKGCLPNLPKANKHVKHSHLKEVGKSRGQTKWR